ncbi:hypothetical protein C8F04DRAFT_1151411 [Mycena alexandri]|uniref:Uncharacterized protein n=1 Tax=Mycena alexandri TaxID=1745969 RepID=A0AAD6S1E5_9AGAR|nr:hypothetical protein C8F04DRAFT_1151411 [Mycena alexandri]
MKSRPSPLCWYLPLAAIARNCTPDLDYCGRTLLEIGKYQPQIDQALHDAGAGEANGGSDDRFHCVGGSNGVITFLDSAPMDAAPNPTCVSDTCN